MRASLYKMYSREGVLVSLSISVHTAAPWIILHKQAPQY